MEEACTAKIDELGRIVLKKAIRAALKWETGDKIAMSLGEDGTVILKLEAKESK